MGEKGGGRAKRLRCAIYTRKSSDEGLEQEFNSLHAQREACEAFIAMWPPRWQVSANPGGEAIWAGTALWR